MFMFMFMLFMFMFMFMFYMCYMQYIDREQRCDVEMLLLLL